jgi:diguanylate cyclase (GGDEF)-like protein
VTLPEAAACADHYTVTRRAVALVALAVAFLPPASCRAADPEPPTAVIGAALPGEAPAASLLRPSIMRAVFRVPRADTALYVGTSWFVRDLSVTVVGPGSRRQTIVATTDLPGHTLGLRLPGDAWAADRIELQASTVIAVSPPYYLLSAEQLARIAWRNWWYAALFGLFAALAVVFGLLGLRVRSQAAVVFAAVMTANAALLIPWLGIVRPPPEISQPLHALEQSLAFAGFMLFAQTYFAGTRLPPLAVRAAWALVLIDIVAVCGLDVLQDLWIIPDPLTQALLVALYLTYVALGVLALRRRAGGAWLYIAGTAAAALGVLVADGAAGGSPVVQSAAMLGGAAQALCLAFALALRIGGEGRGLSEIARWTRLDGLTGLTNRTALDEALAAGWERSRLSHAPLGAVLIDVDHFKSFNETYGHLAGDDALRRIGVALTEAIARFDDVAGRYAGDTFLLLLANTDLAGAYHVAETIRLAVAALDIGHGGAPSRRLSVSAGAAAVVAAYPGDGTALVRRAETALYIAQTMGRNRAVADEPLAPPVASP